MATDTPVNSGGHARGFLDGLRDLSGERRDKIVTYTLVEVLTILVFLSAAYGVVAKDEAEREIKPLRETVEGLEAQVADLRADVRDLAAERNDLMHIVGLLQDAWREIANKEVAANPDREEIEAFIESLRNRAPEIAVVLDHAPGRPVCKPPENFLVEVDFLIDGMRVRPRWGAEYNETAQASEYLVAFVEDTLMSRVEFRRRARRVALSREECVFQIVSILKHNDATLYSSQLDDTNMFYVVRE